MRRLAAAAVKSAVQWLLVIAICASGYLAIASPAATSNAWIAPHLAVASLVAKH